MGMSSLAAIKHDRRTVMRDRCIFYKYSMPIPEVIKDDMDKLNERLAAEQSEAIRDYVATTQDSPADIVRKVKVMLKKT